MDNISYDAVFITIALSVIGGVITAYLLKIRNKRIERKLEDLDEHEAFLERLSKGNIRLLRVTFCIILLSLSTISFGVLALIIMVWLQPSETIKFFLSIFIVGPLTVTGVYCIFHFNHILDSANIKEAKEKLDSKREKLKDKIL